MSDCVTKPEAYLRRSGIQRLYHYENFQPEYLAALLRDQRIHCSNPGNLNDPWDCRPWFDTCFADRTARREMIAWVLMLDSGDAEDEEHICNFERAVEKNPAILQRVTINNSKNVFQMFRAHWSIYCLTPYACSTLMWSHYADKHRRICLEFGTDNDLFQYAQQVRYLSTYPIWHPRTVLNTRMEEAMLTKSDDWKYEQEYRLIARRSNAGGPVGRGVLLSDDGYLNLPAGALKSIIAGCEANYELLAAVTRHHAPNLPIKRAVRSPNHYRLDVVSDG